MKAKRIICILVYIILAILPSIIYTVNSLSLSILVILSGIFGISSYVMFSFQFLLASRIKIIDKQFGLDRVYRFHMVVAVAALVFAYIHKVLKELYYSESFKTQLGDITFVIFLLISVFSTLMMINKLFFKINIVDFIRKFLNEKIKIQYQYKVFIHNLTLIGLFILLFHILLAYSVKSSLLLKVVLILYFIIPLAFYFNHKIIKGYLNKSKKFVVSEVINESNNVVTLKFKPKNGKLFQYLPGQFVYIRIKNSKIPSDEHPFTISSSSSNPDYLSVTVKQLGDFSSKLHLAKVGDSVYIDGAFGSFSYLKEKENRKICFIAGGIGITPFLGMIRHMHDVGYNNDVILLWGAKDRSEIICREELESYAVKQIKFNFVPVLSNDADYTGEKGFITNELIQKYVHKVQEYDFFICGPSVMLEMEIKNLKSLGVSRKNIHFERFVI